MTLADGLLDPGVGIAISFSGTASCREQLKAAAEKRANQAAFLKIMEDLLLFSGKIAEMIDFSIEQGFKEIILGFIEFFHRKHLQ